MTVVNAHDSEITLALKHQIVVQRSRRTDIVDDKYEIQIDDPISDLSTEFCKYYPAINIENKKEYFAIVCEKSFNVSIPLLDKLKHYSVDNGFIRLLTYGIVRISSDNICRVVAIVDKYNYTATLAEYVKNNGGLDDAALQHSLIPTLNQVLQFCTSYDICCGNINLHNVLILDNGRFCLREFFTTPSHFYQDKVYLAPEIAGCISYARETLSIASDIYATGIAIYSAYTGLDLTTESMNDEDYNKIRLEHGTFNTITRKKKLSRVKKLSKNLAALIQYAVQDDVGRRCETKHILEWINGTFDRASSEAKALQHGTSITFDGCTYNSPRILASSMYKNPEAAWQLITSDVLLKWVQRNIEKNDILSTLSVLTSRGTKKYSTTSSLNQDAVFKVLLALDGTGNNIRITDTCFTCDAIPHLLFYGIETGHKHWTDAATLTISNRWWQQFITDTPYGHLHHTYVNLLINLGHIYTHSTPSCGIERIMYTLNPYLPCNSPSVADAYVITLSECLTTLEDIATHNPERLVVDWRLIAFLSSRLGINDSANLKVLRDFPNISNTLISQMTVLLAKSSLEQPGVKLDNLSAVIGQRLTELIEKNIHNIKLIKILSDRINDAAKACDFLEMVAIISNAKIFHNDNTGYKKACTDVVALNENIALLSNTESAQKLNVLFGQRVAMFISYTLCFLVAVALVI